RRGDQVEIQARGEVREEGPRELRGALQFRSEEELRGDGRLEDARHKTKAYPPSLAWHGGDSPDDGKPPCRKDRPPGESLPRSEVREGLRRQLRLPFRCGAQGFHRRAGAA